MASEADACPSSTADATPKTGEGADAGTPSTVTPAAATAPPRRRRRRRGGEVRDAPSKQSGGVGGSPPAPAAPPTLRQKEGGERARQRRARCSRGRRRRRRGGAGNGREPGARPRQGGARWQRDEVVPGRIGAPPTAVAQCATGGRACGAAASGQIEVQCSQSVAGAGTFNIFN